MDALVIQPSNFLKRYTDDGYGQRDDGGAFDGWGTGRPWPLLTGKRGHYELSAGRDQRGFIRALENFATRTRLVPQQIWDLSDRPDSLMYFGKPTGAAMPLMWAHAEYINWNFHSLGCRAEDLFL